jgi:DNA modification methylase
MSKPAGILVEVRKPSDLRPHPKNSRKHSKAQLRQLADSIRTFGFTNPALISDENEIIAGHGRVEAAKLVGLAEIPVIRLSHLSPLQRRAYVIADNKLALNAAWNIEVLAEELVALEALNFDLPVLGFSIGELDAIIGEAGASSPDGEDADEDQIPEPTKVPVSRVGDIWELGRHRLKCGDALSFDDYKSLVGARSVDMIFTDPPYNVPIYGHVCGSGRIRHREFAMGVGEMNPDEFTRFLASSLSAAANLCRDGAIAFVCMDWRHMGELIAAGREAFSELKNVCVWNKKNAGQGTFYRSKHEMVFVFKIGSAEHVNNFGLGANGRYRTNVWDYAGISSISASRLADLAMHPTVKPTALVADAIKDCSRRGGTILDPFGGSGTTLIAAEGTGRRALLMELDPLYCDTVIRRFEKLTGKSATLVNSGATFEHTAEKRLKDGPAPPSC